MSASVPLRCKCRKQAATSLRCARCSVPICPDCSIVAPAGMLCKECTHGRKSSLYQVGALSLAKSYPITLLASVFGGWLFATFLQMGPFSLFIGFLYGLGVGEVGLRVTNRKRGREMEVMAGVCALLGVIGGYALWLGAAYLSHPHSPDLAESGYIQQPSLLMMSTFLSPWTYVAVGLVVFGAINRVRNI